MGDKRQDADLDQRLRGVAREIRERRGPCPSTETLSRFCAGLSAGSELSAIQSHIASCGICEAVVMRMRRFDEIPRRDWSWVYKAAPGYALALVLAVPAYRWWMREEPSVVEIPDGVLLSGYRSQGAPAPMIETSSLAILHFYLPARKEATYRATLRTESGKEIVVRLPLKSWDGQGNFQLLVRKDRLPRSRYLVQIEELSLGGEVTNQWTLRFER